MNVNIVLGRIKKLIGACQRGAARATGNSIWEETGVRRCRAGRQQIAIGEARRIIKQYVARLQTR